jgi:hypothetical protein
LKGRNTNYIINENLDESDQTGRIHKAALKKSLKSHPEDLTF